PLLVAVTAVALYFALKHKRERWPFLLSLLLFALTFVGLGISLYPYIVPDHVTIWEAAAPESSQIFMLVGAAILIPVILAYTSYAYGVFRRKVGHEGYHCCARTPRPARCGSACCGSSPCGLQAWRWWARWLTSCGSGSPEPAPRACATCLRQMPAPYACARCLRQ